jgi:hypothetical protein
MEDAGRPRPCPLDGGGGQNRCQRGHRCGRSARAPAPHGLGRHGASQRHRLAGGGRRWRPAAPDTGAKARLGRVGASAHSNRSVRGRGPQAGSPLPPGWRKPAAPACGRRRRWRPAAPDTGAKARLGPARCRRPQRPVGPGRGPQAGSPPASLPFSRKGQRGVPLMPRQGPAPTATGSSAATGGTWRCWRTTPPCPSPVTGRPEAVGPSALSRPSTAR